MKIINVICEGHSENEFVDNTLRPFFLTKGIQIIAFKITQSDGGLSNYKQFKNDILKCVYSENTIVTSLIDYYALPIDFPKYNDSTLIVDKSDRLNFLELAIKQDIENETGRNLDNLIPYMHL